MSNPKDFARHEFLRPPICSLLQTVFWVSYRECKWHLTALRNGLSIFAQLLNDL